MLASLCLLCCTPVQAQTSDEDPVTQGREALQAGPSLPWYDEETDELKRIDVKTRQEPPPATGQTAQPSDRSTAAGPTAASGGGIFTPILYTGLIVLAVVLIGLLVLVIMARMKQAAMPERDPRDRVSYDEVDRVEELPFEVRKPQSDLLEEARRLYEQGNYDEAILYLYSYQLVQLDKNHVIRLTRGKTNRQYLGETRRCPPLDALLERTMIAFEDAFFGNLEIGRVRFESCWHQLDTFQNHLQQLSA